MCRKLCVTQQIAGTRRVSASCAICSRSSMLLGLLSKGRSTMISEGKSRTRFVVKFLKVSSSVSKVTGIISRLVFSPICPCCISNFSPRQTASRFLNSLHEKTWPKIFCRAVSICTVKACLSAGGDGPSSGKATIFKILSTALVEVVICF